MLERLIVGNWKMNTTIEQARSLAQELVAQIRCIDGVRTIVCPPFISIPSVSDVLYGTDIGLGAQDMHFEENGAYTGAVAPEMLVGICGSVIVGHSERRQYFQENDEMINKKIKAAYRVGLSPILCVGEALSDRESGHAYAFVETQLINCLTGVTSTDKLVIAYEPIWAIGTGQAATPEVAQDMMAKIRKTLTKIYGVKAAKEIPLLYGGSVGPANIYDFIKEADIDGALVGGASLNAVSFADIVRNGAEA